MLSINEKHCDDIKNLRKMREDMYAKLGIIQEEDKRVEKSVDKCVDI